VIEINIRVLVNPLTEEEQIKYPDIPVSFTGYAVSVNEEVISKGESKDMEDRLIDYLIPRLRSAMGCMVSGKPFAVAIFSPDAEASVSRTIEEVVISASMNNGIDMLFPSDKSKKGGLIN
jgi:hypothetical protein